MRPITLLAWPTSLPVTVGTPSGRHNCCRCRRHYGHEQRPQGNLLRAVDGPNHETLEEVAVVIVATNCVGQNDAMMSTFSILPFLIYAPLIALLVIGIWVGILGIRALNKYLRTSTTEPEPPH